jgi:CheY-like chemotaxis protein
LVVEDETLVGLELKEDLERLGYFVPEVIESGEAVVQAVARHQPDLVLMDVHLRGSLDGIEAAYQAKAEFDLPVIYLTAYSDAETLRRAAMTSPGRLPPQALRRARTGGQRPDRPLPGQKRGARRGGSCAGRCP